MKFPPFDTDRRNLVRGDQGAGGRPQKRRILKKEMFCLTLTVGHGRVPRIGSLLHPADSDTGDTMMLSLYVALGIFLLIAVRNPSASQPDRLRSMVKLRPCRGNVDTGTRNRQPARRISGRVDCACCHRCSPDRVGSGEVGGAGIGSRLAVRRNAARHPDPDTRISKVGRERVVNRVRLLDALRVQPCCAVLWCCSSEACPRSG